MIDLEQFKKLLLKSVEVRHKKALLKSDIRKYLVVQCENAVSLDHCLAIAWDLSWSFSRVMRALIKCGGHHAASKEYTNATQWESRRYDIALSLFKSKLCDFFPKTDHDERRALLQKASTMQEAHDIALDILGWLEIGDDTVLDLLIQCVDTARE